jgi:hypothetical protein
MAAMDEKRAALLLPGHSAFPGVDDHLVEPEVTRDEIIIGRRVVALPAEAPEADKQLYLGALLRVHVAPGYTASAKLLTRHAVDSDFASDVCVRRDGIEPATGKRYLEEIAFEVVATQNERKLTEKADVMSRRGVRRVFGIWVKGRRRVCEWSTESGSWLPLDAGSRIEDPCLGAPLPVAALLDATWVDRAVVEALVVQGNPDIQQREAAAEARGEARGAAAAVLKVLQARGIAVSEAQRQEILACHDLDRLDRWLTRAALAASAEEVLADS